MIKLHFGAVVFVVSLLLTSVAINPSSAEETFGGSGLVVAQIYDQETEDHLGSLVVLQVLPNSPASKQNIKNADIITHIDGDSTRGKTFEHLILNDLRGPIGSTIQLIVKRMGMNNPISVEMNRIELSSLKTN